MSIKNKFIYLGKPVLSEKSDFSPIVPETGAAEYAKLFKDDTMKIYSFTDTEFLTKEGTYIFENNLCTLFSTAECI